MSSSTAETAILDRMMAGGQQELPADAARYLPAIEFASVDRDRMNELAIKAQDGALTYDEAGEPESYCHVSHLLALLQSKARKSLGHSDLA